MTRIPADIAARTGIIGREVEEAPTPLTAKLSWLDHFVRNARAWRRYGHPWPRAIRAAWRTTK